MRDGDPEESDTKQQRAIKAFFGFLNRHPDRRDHFIRSVVNAGAPKEAVERVLGDEDLFISVVLGNRETTKGDLMTTGITAGPDYTER